MSVKTLKMRENLIKNWFPKKEVGPVTIQELEYKIKTLEDNIKAIARNMNLRLNEEVKEREELDKFCKTELYPLVNELNLR